ncbi:carbon-nitrogen hydrolase [Dactylonectria macrodidyma]|uniref:Carbon-nitrogen hydrolase n=1 Tax=Dactylonectria macrodidyma TaxID=307937 RepID=A0A9P9FNY5_9HYPO|nr:carbon-nitrogen hydrolase [Dactylonectria macrodidyma]
MVGRNLDQNLKGDAVKKAKVQQRKTLKKAVKIACVQFATADKKRNIEKACGGVLAAATAGANIIVLPECSNSPYDAALFAQYAEVLQLSLTSEKASLTYDALRHLAREASVYLIGGSIPELEVEMGKYFSTTLVFSPLSEILGLHRKMHLFDIHIPGQMKFRESDTLSPGNSISIVYLPDYGCIGLGICYDISFPEPAMIAARSGVFALIYPSAFNSTTGPLHWELLARAGALYNQVFIIAVACDQEETIIYTDIDDEIIQRSCQSILTSGQRQFDIYVDVSKPLRVV